MGWNIMKTKELRHPWEDKKGGSSILTWSATPYGSHNIRPENQSIIKELAQEFQKRLQQANLPMDDCNKASLEYWIGAATITRLSGQTQLSEDIAKLGVLEISPRGYQAISELALF
jgi:hypothetical protein